MHIGEAQCRNVEFLITTPSASGVSQIAAPSPPAPPSNLLRNAQIYNNRFVRTGNEALQVQQLGEGSHVHHNVMLNAALHYRDNGLGAYQDNNSQVLMREGNVLIEHNVFDDLDDSDAVHGFGGGVIRYNHMDHALPAGDGNHNDFIQIGNGGPWTIDGNWFGVRTGGAATIWVDSIDKGVIHDVLIQNNVLTGHYVGQDVGIFIAGDDRQVALLPSNVRVLNNTVTSGLLNSLRFGAHYADVPVEQRPLVANNVGERLRGMCDRIRSEDNVFADGEACAAGDVIGDAALAPDGAPTAASALLLGKADPLVTPPLDYFGCTRGDEPDIGAVELGACPVPAQPTASPAATHIPSSAPAKPFQARARARARVVSLRTKRLARRVVVFVRCSNAAQFTASLLVRGHVFSTASRRGSSNVVKLTLRAPRTGRLKVRIRAVGAGGASTRLITIRAPRN